MPLVHLCSPGIPGIPGMPGIEACPAGGAGFAAGAACGFDVFAGATASPASGAGIRAVPAPALCCSCCSSTWGWADFDPCISIVSDIESNDATSRLSAFQLSGGDEVGAAAGDIIRSCS
jgi:hypothetical protein